MPTMRLKLAIARKIENGVVKTLRAEPERQHCNRCGERYLLQNLKDCTACKNYTCPNCGKWRVNPATNEEELICDLCFEYHEGWWNVAGTRAKVRVWTAEGYKDI